MKKILSLLCMLAVLSFSACGTAAPADTSAATATAENAGTTTAGQITSSTGEPSPQETTTAATQEQTQAAKPSSPKIILENIDDFKEVVNGDIERTISALEADFDVLKTDIDTYKKFIDGSDKMEEFYAGALDATNDICLRLRNYAVQYAEMVMSSGEDFKDKYKSLEKIYKVVYDSARDDLMSDIYNGVMSDIYDFYYDGILSDAHQNGEYGDYSEWSKVRSKEYKRRSDTRSDIYKAISDMGSDVYSFYSSIRSSVYNKNADDAQKDIAGFYKDIDKLTQKLSGNSGGLAVNTTSTDLSVISTLDELEELIENDTESTIAGLNSEFEALKAEIDTYAKYCDNTEKIEAFYEKICGDCEALCVRMREYAAKYAELILEADTDFKKKYKDIDKIYKNIYNGALDDIYSDVYNGLLDDMYSLYYNGILDSAYSGGEVEYSEWSKVLSKEYKMYSDAGSDVYKAYSSAGSDIYSFYSSVSSDLYKSDKESAREEIDDFIKDIEKMKAKLG